jgi:hypothetical protein
MHLALRVGHRAPFSCGKDTLFRGLGLITKYFPNQMGICPNALQKHKVCTQGFLRRIRILDIALPRFPGLSLCSAKGILAFDVIGCEGAHVSSELSFTSVLCGL